MTKNVTIQWFGFASYEEAWVYLDNGDRVHLVINPNLNLNKMRYCGNYCLITEFWCGEPKTPEYKLIDGDRFYANEKEGLKKLAIEAILRYNSHIGALSRK